MRRLRWIGLVLTLGLGACGAAPAGAGRPGSEPRPAPAPAPSGASEPRGGAALPDAETLTSLSRRMDASCKDSCCVPELAWVWGSGALPAEVRRAAERSAASLRDPAPLALALRVLARGATPADAETFARFVDDERPGGSLPTVHVTQRVEECYPVVWERTSPSREALRALGEVHARRFESPAAWRAWRAATPDPERSFEVWDARLARQTPPPPALVRELAAKDAALFTRVMLHRCDRWFRCGVERAELAELVRKNLGRDGAFALLERDRVPEHERTGAHTWESLLAAGDLVFAPEDVPRLEKLWSTGHFARTVYQGQLGLLLARLAPASARRYWTESLGGGGFRLADEGAELVLREAARRDPAGMEPRLKEWLFDPPSATGPAGAIFAGLAEAEPAGAAVLGRLLAKDFASRDYEVVAPLARALRRHGCAAVPADEALQYYPKKNSDPKVDEEGLARVRAARDEVVRAAKACQRALAQRR